MIKGGKIKFAVAPGAVQLVSIGFIIPNINLLHTDMFSE